MFIALGKFSYRFRWFVIAGWLLLLAASLVVTPYLSGVLRGGGFSNPDSPAEQAAALVEERLGQGQASVVVVFSSTTLDATSTEFRTLEAQTLAGLTPQTIPHLLSVQTYATTGSPQFLSKDGKSSVAVVTFDAPSQVVQDEVGLIRDTLGAAYEKAASASASEADATASTALQIHVTGEPAVNADLSEISVSDLQKVELYALPVALVALVLVFGTLVAAALPVITGALAVSVTLGAIYLLGRVTNVSIFSMNTATLLGLAVAIDYALFIVARYREEIHQGASVEEATVASTAWAGRSVFFSGAAVVVGVLGLTFFPFPALRSIGIGAAVVVFFSVAASLTFMPALLGVLGRRVDRVRLVPLRPPHESRFWRAWSGILLRRPWAVIIVSLALIAPVAGPIVHIRTEMPSATALPATADSRQGYDILDKEFDRAALSPISVLVTWDGGSEKLDMTNALPLYAFGQKLVATPGVASVTSIFTLPGMEDPAALAALWEKFQALLGDSGDISSLADSGLLDPSREGLDLGNGVTVTPEQLAQIQLLVDGSVGERAVLFRVMSATDPASAETQELVGTIAGMTVGSGYHIHVAGEAASNLDFFDGLGDRLPWVIVWVALASFVVLLFLLRSLALPLLSIVVNGLTILMSFGSIVFIFQDGYLADLLRFTVTGATDAIIPVVLLCVLFGISMDYGVFLLTRMHEAYLKDGDARASVGTGLVQSGRIILSAALLVVVVTGAFAFTSISITKTLGLGIAVAIAADALLVRMSLLPALMCYLGKAEWWLPRWLERGLPDTGHAPKRLKMKRSGLRTRPQAGRG